MKVTEKARSCLDVHLHSISVMKASDYVAHKLYSPKAKIRRINDDIIEPRDLEKFEEDAKQGKRIATLSLMNILRITQKNALKALEDYPMLRVLPKKDIYENFQVLREGDVLKSTIRDNKFLLTSSMDELKKKIDLIKSLDMDVNNAASLFLLSVAELKYFAMVSKVDAIYMPDRNRLYYLAEKLKRSMSEICHVVSYKPDIMSLPPTTLLTSTEYVLEAGMAPEHILCDMSIYRVPFYKIETRIEYAKKLGIHPLRPWIVRHSPDGWRPVKEKFVRRNVLIGSDISREKHICEICKIFECDMDVAKYLDVKDSKIFNMSIDKLSNKARMIRAEGYMVNDIVKSPEILQKSVNTIKRRFVQWNAAGLPKGPLSIYGLAEKRFQRKISQRIVENKTEP